MDNPNNKLISKEKVEDILNYFGNIGDNNERLSINNLDYYQRSFVHESYHQSCQNYIKNPDPNTKIYLNYISKMSSEILEYYGDNILKAVLGRYLYQRFDTEREGFLTRLKIKIEKCSMLHKFAVTLGFKEYLLLSLQIENQTILDIDRGRNTPSYYEDAFESFLGSLMEDFDEKGYIYADRFVRNIIENVIDFSELISQNDNFKDSLQRFFQSLKWKTPVYININEEGPLYRKVFTRMLLIKNTQFDELNSVQQIAIKRYTNECLQFYKFQFPKIFEMLYKEVSENNNYILCIGSAKKIVSSDQEAAKKALETLGLDQNY